LSYPEPEVSPANLNTTNTTWSSFYLTWDSIDAFFIPGVLRSYRITYKIIDPAFDQFNGAYDGSFLVDSWTTAVNVTGLIGWSNYEVMVNGVTVKDGPGNFTYLQTEEGSKIILLHLYFILCFSRNPWEHGWGGGSSGLDELGNHTPFNPY
jgi:hypothetical protein